MRSTPSRRSDASHSFRMESGRSTRRASFMRSRSSYTSPHLVNTSGRSRDGSSRGRRPTSSSEWPRPYTAAVSIQLIPSSSARCIAASESVSSCGPQPNAQPPPPIAHAPKPTVVISSPLEPSGRVGRVIRTAPGDWRSRSQQHLPRGLASFQQAVRLRRLRERELALDAHRQLSALDPAQQLAGPPEQLGARRDVVRQRGPGEEQRALLAQHLRVERSHRSARLAVQHHHSPGREAAEALLEGGLPDGIVDHLQPGSVRQTLHFSLEVLLGIQDDLIGACPACQRGLLARRDRAQHPCALEFGDLAEQETHAARGGVHQACVPRLQGVGRGREVVRRHALEHYGGALLRAHAVRQHDDPVGRDDGVLGIRAEQARIRDALPNFGCGHAGANGAHSPRRFLTQRDRQRGLVVPCALVDVDEVHARSFDLYEHLAGARGGPLDLLVPQRLRAARRVYPNRFHPGLVYLEHMKISFIGLGSMGLPMARHLLQAGPTLTVYNRTRARADQLKQFNPVVADSPAAAVRDAEVLVTMVADDAALENVMLGPDGALAALPRGAIHVSMSTISAADEVAAPMPLASLIRDRYLSGVARGWGDIDWAGLARIAAADAGLTPPRSPG